MKRISNILLCLSLITTLVLINNLSSLAQKRKPGFNYEESKVPQYELPALLTTNDGQNVDSKEMWQNVRRAEILQLFKDNVYGNSPKGKYKVKYTVRKHIDSALNGKAVYKEILMTFSRKGKKHEAVLSVFLPKNATKPSPLFIITNVSGNQGVCSDLNVSITDKWITTKSYAPDNVATAKSRGVRKHPIELLLDRGYGFATIYGGDFFPDKDNGYGESIQPLFYKKYQQMALNHEWGCLATWAWGLSRCMDYFETDVDIDESKIAVVGHSRRGKAALWAGATDERFALTISNNSGCGGAALSRREFGETVKRIDYNFPHWFCNNFRDFRDDVTKMPVDQHMLIALMAPRPVYVASGKLDEWADPKGEFLSALNASPAYKLFDLIGLPTFEMPEVDRPVKNGTIGYHIRNGGHGLKLYDWKQYLDFADYHFNK